jgi:acyl-CoA thioesterase-1
LSGRPRLNQTDGIHPTAEGHEKIADNVWDVLAPVLRGRS